MGWVTSHEGLQLSFQVTPSASFITKELFCSHPGSACWALAAPESPWHFSHVGDYSCCLWGRNPNSHKNMVRWSEISIWNWPGPDNALSNFLPVFSSPPLPLLCFSPFIFQLHRIPHQAGPSRPSALKRLGPEAVSAEAVWIFSLWGSSPFSVLFPQGLLREDRVGATPLRACEGTQRSPSWRQGLGDQMQMWICQWEGRGMRANEGKDPSLSH